MSDLLYSLSLSLLLFPIFFIIPIAAQFNDSNYPNCRSYVCGNININYPFWRIGSETTTQFCGYPGFGINCSYAGEVSSPSITLGNDSYSISNIIYERETMALINDDIYNAVSTIDCSKLRHNISIGALPFVFANQNVNLSFHFNCNGVPDFASEIPCLSSATNKSFVNRLDYEPPNYNWDDFSCDEDAVVTTVLDVFGSQSRLGTEFIVALRGGFELKWERNKDCEKCEVSGGRCGYDSNTTEFLCFCSGGTTSLDHCVSTSMAWKKIVVGIGSALLAFALMFIIYCIMISSRKFVTFFKHQTEDDKSVEAFVIQYGSLSTKRYTYSDIKIMTNSFRVKLGQGGFGIVFKGTLSDGRLVAVKILNSSKATGQEFINEVASIGRTSHINIVALLGFCFEYEKRALVYEFMPNGSLDRFIYGHAPLNPSGHMKVEKLYQVSLGIAHGLDYLHRGCTTRILHLDIKPHNILLDEDFCPKIADFGLAKLYSRKESIVSMLEARGTIGYIAPEVFMRNFGGVSHKSDVYSYGMLILEMVGGRKNVDIGVAVGSGHTSEIYFPYWIYNRLKNDEFLLDSVTTIEENEYAKKMTIVGLWCIQTDPRQRPSINEVIDMLQGSMEALEIPPKPFFASPPRSPATTFNTSQEINGAICSLKEA